MSNEKFCLRWNDFENNISEAFKDLLEEKDFFDVTLSCDNEQIQAHKLILSACSPFFRNILRRNPHQHPLLYLKGVKYTDLQSVLNFMYHGEVSVAQEELNSFLAVAEDLKVKGLTQNNQSNENLSKKDYNPSHRTAVIKDKPPNKAFKRESNPKSSLKSQYDTSPSNNDEEDIEEVTVVKAEPKDLPPPPPPIHHPVGQVGFSSHTQQSSYAITTTEDNSDIYNDENYEEYQQFDEEQEYQRVEEGNASVGHNKGQAVQDPSDLLQFVRKDQADQKFHCTLCENFSHKVITCARNHVESKHYPNVFSYSCDQCEETFSTKTNLNAHRTRKHKQMKTQQFYLA